MAYTLQKFEVFSDALLLNEVWVSNQSFFMALAVNLSMVKSLRYNDTMTVSIDWIEFSSPIDRALHSPSLLYCLHYYVMAPLSTISLFLIPSNVFVSFSSVWKFVITEVILRFDSR